MGDLGQIGLVRTVGFSSWLIRLVTRSHWNHTITRVSEHRVVSVQPSGVQIMYVDDFPDAVWSEFDLTESQENHIIAFNLAQQGKPYGHLTFIWIGIARLMRLSTPAWLEATIADQHTWICSQLCDAAYQNALIPLFDDGRPSGAVVPGDIGKVFHDFGWTDKP